MNGGKKVNTVQWIDINPLPHKLFLDHDIILKFKTSLKKIKNFLSKVLNTSENIMENGAFAPME